MNNSPSSIQNTLPTGLTSHGSPYDLSKLILDEESCFGTDKRYACARSNCQWRGECMDTSSIWMR